MTISLFNSDCRAKIPTVDLVLTSVPFLDKDVDKPYSEWFGEVITEIELKCKVALVFVSSRKLVELISNHPPRAVLIWDKKVGMGAFRYEPILVYSKKPERLWGQGRIWADCIAIPPIVGKKQLVPYENPVPLYVQLLRYFPEFKTVCDPFMGSGTTGIACLEQKRDFVGFEINPKYFEIAKDRLEARAKELGVG